jgi:uncharacterized protein
LQELKFAKGLSLPTDAVTQKFAFLGRTGSGKSYAAKRLVESLLSLRAQVVILDPVGIWHGLRVGDQVSFDIPVLGGLHGDLPLAPTAGAVVARIACERSTSMVLDVSQMHDAERTRFSEAFAREFFQLKKAAPSPVMLALEELQEFAPQNPNPGEQMMLHEFQRIAKLGRNFGIGILGISQRPQECSKKLLNQTECVVAFQMTGPQERKALEYWLSDRGIESKDLGKLLPTLEVGKPLLWSPQWLKLREVIEILPIDTSDTSRTPKFGTAATTFELRPIDVNALREKLSEATESVAKDDPKALRARIKELDLLVAQGAGPAAAPVVVFDKKKAEKLRDSHEQHVSRAQQLLQWEHQELREIFDRVEKLLRNAPLLEQHLESNTLAEDLGAFLDDLRDGAKLVPTTHPKTLRASPSELPNLNAPGVAPPKSAIGTGLPSGELATLSAIARKKGGAMRSYLVLVTGLRKASIETYVQKLVTRGYVRRGDGMLLFATAAAFALLPEMPQLPTGEELVKYHTGVLPGGESTVFSIVASEHPRLLKRDTIIARSGLSAASVETYAQKLVTRGLLQRHPDKKVGLHSEFGL